MTTVAGVMVVAIQEGEPAAEAGIRPGDVLVTIDGHPVDDLTDYSRVRALLADRGEPVEILVRTGSVENYVLVLPDSSGVEQ